MAGRHPDGYDGAAAFRRSRHVRGPCSFSACRARETVLCFRTAAAKSPRKTSPPGKTVAAAVARKQPALCRLPNAGFTRLATRGLVSGARREIAEGRIRRSIAQRMRSFRRWGNWPRDRNAVSSIPSTYCFALTQLHFDRDANEVGVV